MSQGFFLSEVSYLKLPSLWWCRASRSLATEEAGSVPAMMKRASGPGRLVQSSRPVSESCDGMSDVARRPQLSPSCNQNQ